MALNAMAIDVILPALQQMGESLSVTDENTRQLPLTAYIVVFGLSQLVYGTLSDHFGRRPVLLVGLVIYVIGCTGSALAGSFTMLLAMRAAAGDRRRRDARDRHLGRPRHVRRPAHGERHVARHDGLHGGADHRAERSARSS